LVVIVQTTTTMLSDVSLGCMYDIGYIKCVCEEWCSGACVLRCPIEFVVDGDAALCEQAGTFAAERVDERAVSSIEEGRELCMLLRRSIEKAVPPELIQPPQIFLMGASNLSADLIGGEKASLRNGTKHIDMPVSDPQRRQRT
jgi:hypothetical protein